VDTPALEFGFMTQLPGVASTWWWMATSSGRFATGISMTNTTDATLRQTTWSINSLARDVWFLQTNCGGDPYTTDPIVSVDQDLMLLNPASAGLAPGASLRVDIYTPDMSDAPTIRTFVSKRAAITGQCTNVGALSNGRRAPMTAHDVAFTNTLQLRF
jgi:hypothetical protein